MRARVASLITIAALAGAGCSDKGLMDLRAPGDGPDEFMLEPVKPLTQPRDYSFLPPPTPGGPNLTDRHPVAEATEELGGRPPAPGDTAVPSSDGALVSAASRYGVPANARQVIDEEDAEFRKRQARWSRVRLFPVDRYSQAYRKQALDPFRQTQLFRNRNAGTPSAPPAF